MQGWVLAERVWVRCVWMEGRARNVQRAGFLDLCMRVDTCAQSMENTSVLSAATVQRVGSIADGLCIFTQHPPTNDVDEGGEGSFVHQSGESRFNLRKRRLPDQSNSCVSNCINCRKGQIHPWICRIYPETSRDATCMA